MRRLIVFNQVSLDGYFSDLDGDMSWAHKDDAEWKAFAGENAGSGGLLVFGRKTYDQMASWWPTPMARQALPAVADGMNASPKIVFSNTLRSASWKNTTVLRGDVAEQIARLKREEGPHIAIMGSGSIVSACAQAGLVDELQIVVNPIVLGSGRSMFEGVSERLPMRLVRSRTFQNGNLLLCYAPAA